MRQDGKRHAAHPAGGSCNEHLPAIQRYAPSKQAVDREPCRKACSAEHHCLPKRKARRQRKRPGRRHPYKTAETAGGVHAQIVARHDDLVARLKRAVGTGGHHARRVDAGSVRIVFCDAPVPGSRKHVLVVQRGVAHLDHQFAFRQLVDGALLYGPREGVVLPFADHQSLEFFRHLYPPFIFE
ncbi:MAG: hypothetical protein BWY96_02643 [Spirochaetes bacterium ADurb.BinA120]|nr:MAG: hypothetical protein BWY96_02643 [Spirochaetes bacterium ADurb.BinA120]